MIQLKIILDTRRKKSDGTYPVMFRVTNVKKVNYLSSGISVQSDHWDEITLTVKRSQPNYKSLNLMLTKKYYEIQKAILGLEHSSTFTFEALKCLLFPQLTPSVKQVSFNEYAGKLIQEMFELNKTGNALVYQTATKRFIEYVGSDCIDFNEIDYTLLDSFRHQLLMDGIKLNSISNYFRTLRAIYNKAIKTKLISREHYPFSDLSIATEKTAKRAILQTDMVNLCQLNVDHHPGKWNARNYFLLSFSLIGMSFTDLAYLKTSNIVDGRLVYRRRKTNRMYDIKMTPVSIQILNVYKDGNTKYLLPIVPDHVTEDSLVCKKLILQWIKTTNKWLKVMGKDCEIAEPITTYVARHTWATIAKRLGYSNEIIGEALGHETGNRITNIYLDAFDHKMVDEVNKNVLQPLENVSLKAELEEQSGVI